MAAPALARAQTVVDAVYGLGQQQYFASSVASFSDFDRDGIEDFVLATPCDNQNGQPLSGSVKVYCDRPAHERLNLLGEKSGDLFGSAIARLPDLDCDGVDEILVGAPGASLNGRASGRAYVFSGADARILYYLAGKTAGEEFGAAVCSVGDLDGDGAAEFAVGAPGASKEGVASGMVVVFDGADAHIVFRYYGGNAGERFGSSLAGPGDMDGDGIPEIAVGAPCPRMNRPGFARVFSGADALILYTFGGEHTWELFGATLCAVGDLDGDARGDLLVGAPASRTRGASVEDAIDHACGAATLFSGGLGLPMLRIASDESEDRLGTSLALGPDLDGDGAPELFIGATQRLRPRTGCVRAFNSRTGALLETYLGFYPGEQCGASCAVLRDARGPALLLVGSPADATRGGSGVGRATVFDVLRLR